MRKTLFWRALNCLAHPVSVIALFVVILNALVLQRSWPSWWTGKIGDAAWMVFFPFLIATILIWLIPSRWLRNHKTTGLLSIVTVFIGFSLLKSVPIVNSSVVDAMTVLGLSTKLMLDPTDLIVLPILLIAWLVWKQKVVFRPRRSIVLVILVFSLFATMADMIPPPSAYDCLVLMKDNSVIAMSGALGSPYHSSDGGITWVKDSKVDKKTIYCNTFMVWPISLNTQPPITFYYIENEGLYQSLDNGKTLTVVIIQQDEKTHVDYAVVTPFDTLVISSGNGNIWTRTLRGEWLQYKEKYPELLLEQVTK